MQDKQGGHDFQGCHEWVHLLCPMPKNRFADEVLNCTHAQASEWVMKTTPDPIPIKNRIAAVVAIDQYGLAAWMGERLGRSAFPNER